MSDFNWTENIIMCAIIYAIVAALRDDISFIWQYPVGAILLIFIIESVANIISWITRRKYEY